VKNIGGRERVSMPQKQGQIFIVSINPVVIAKALPTMTSVFMMERHAVMLDIRQNQVLQA